MKKQLTILLLAAITLTFSGCASGNTANPTDETTTTAEDTTQETTTEETTAETTEPTENDDSSEVTENDPIDQLEGFTYLDVADSNLRFQYPESWTELSPEILEEPEIMAEISNSLNMSEEALESQLSLVSLILFDTEHSIDTFGGNLNVITNQDIGSIDVYKLTLPQLADEIEQQLANVYSDFEWVLKPEIKEYGNNSVSEMRISGTQGEASISVYQAHVFLGDTVHIFSYSVPTEYEEETTSIWEQLLTTIEQQ